MIRRPPLSSQRWLVMIGLTLFAVMLHSTFCEWHYRERMLTGDHHDQRIVGLIHERVRPVSRGPNILVVSGVFTEAGVSPRLAVVGGVIAPMFLLGTVLYLLLGWQYADRIARGLCPRCRYELKGDEATPKETCPECGWRRADES